MLKRQKALVVWIVLALAILLISCGAVGRKGAPIAPRKITEEKMLLINEETRFTRFYYSDGNMESGLMLHWMPDSVLIQKRGEGIPINIPTVGIVKIETMTGNRSMRGLAIGSLAAAIYAGIVRVDQLGSLTIWEAISKLFVPPAIIVTAVAIGASRETKEIYEIPPDFVFDFELSKRNLRQQKE